MYIERGDCSNCCKCIKSCAVKSILYNIDTASIKDDRCVACGDCVEECPNGYIKVGDDVSKVKQIIKKNKNIALSISSAWIAEFGAIESRRMVEALRLLGFTIVSETAIGASYMADAIAANFNDNKTKVWISTVCPSINNLIENYHHEALPYLLPIATPAILHARMLKSYYGQSLKVVVVSNCLADKKIAENNSDLIDAAITFDELKEWLRSEKVDFEYIPGNDTYVFEPFEADKCHKYIIENGVVDSAFRHDKNMSDVEVISVTGLKRVHQVLGEIDFTAINRPLYLELFSCQCGCLSGPGAVSKINTLAKKLSFLNNISSISPRKSKEDRPLIINDGDYSLQEVIAPVTEEMVIKQLTALSIDVSKNMIDCSACGYDSCRDFAAALINGDATENMCLWSLIQIARDKFSVIIHKTRSGIFIVDRDLKIVEANKSFAQLFGVDAIMAFESNPGMNGEDITRIVPFYKNIISLFEGSEEIIEKDMQVKGRMLKITLFSLHGGKFVCGMVRNLFMHDVRNEEIISRTRQVIDDNLETVQKIAYLLGETASQTEAVLNSIIESQSDDNEQ